MAVWYNPHVMLGLNLFKIRSRGATRTPLPDEYRTKSENPAGSSSRGQRVVLKAILELCLHDALRRHSPSLLIPYALYMLLGLYCAALTAGGFMQ